MRQRHIVHWSAGQGAAHTRRKANEREQGSALRVGQLRRNTHAEIRLRHRQQRQRQRWMRHQRLSILLLTLLLPRPLDALVRSIAHLLQCVAPTKKLKSEMTGSDFSSFGCCGCIWRVGGLGGCCCCYNCICQRTTARGWLGGRSKLKGGRGGCTGGGGVGTVNQKREVWPCGPVAAERPKKIAPRTLLRTPSGRRELLYFQDSVCLGTGPKMSQCISVEMMNSDKKIKQTV